MSGEWESVDRLLRSANTADLLLARASARVELPDAQEVNQVQETAELLARVEREELLPMLSLGLVKVTYDLLKRVIDGYTPLEYERRPLVEALMLRAEQAVELTPVDSNLRVQALVVLGSVAELLRDHVLGELYVTGVEELSDDVRREVFFALNPPPSLDAIQQMVATGQVDASRAVKLRASYFRTAGQLDEFERELREGVFVAGGQKERAGIVTVLVLYLKEVGRTDEALQLIDATALTKRDQWLLRWKCLPRNEISSEMANEASREFELEVEVLEQLALTSFEALRSARRTDGFGADAIEEAAVEWSKRFSEALPSRSVRLLRAEVLLAAGLHERVLEAVSDLDPVHSERRAELTGWALHELHRSDEAASILLKAYRESNNSESLAVNASAALLVSGREEEARELLEPLVDGKGSAPGILVNYARALLIQAPTSQEHASRAFDLLSRAYEIDPEPAIAAEAWKAARGAGRGAEAGNFYTLMLEGSPRAHVESDADLTEAFKLMGTGKYGLVRIAGRIEPLLEFLRRDRERNEALARLTSAHLAPYSDLLRLSRRPWLHWTNWTERFRNLEQDGGSGTNSFSILCDWPYTGTFQSERPAAQQGYELQVLLDQTALLTLGILGADVTLEILRALRVSVLPPATVARLKEELASIEHDLLLGGEELYEQAENVLAAAPETTIAYSEELELAAERCRSLGARRLDVAAAAVEGGFYVSDRGEADDWPMAAAELCISSASLLSALHYAGNVTADEATNAAAKDPETFGGWHEVEAPLLAPVYVFGELALLAWIKGGLIPALGKRLRLGPWATRHIQDEAFQRRSLALAYQRLQTLIRVLRLASEEGVIRELSVADGEYQTTKAADEQMSSEANVEDLWVSGLKSLGMARSAGVALWADDRFYRLLFAPGGPFEGADVTNSLRGELGSWATETPWLSTFEVLDRLSMAGAIDTGSAQDAAALLFRVGYRPVHPLLLDYSIRQFKLAPQPVITPPFQRIADLISEIPSYLPTGDGTERLARLSRLVAVRVAERLVLRAWRSGSLPNSQRIVLSDAFLESVERVCRGESSEKDPAMDRGSLFFWRVLSMALFSEFATEDRFSTDPHRWLGMAAAQRPEDHQIVRLLEDNALDALKLSLTDSELEAEGLDFAAILVGGKLGLRALIPLFETDLLGVVDILLRRTFGFIGGFKRQARTNIVHEVEIDGVAVREVVSEEEMELAAVEALRRGEQGKTVSELIYGTDVVFSYSRPVSEGSGMTVDVRLPLSVLLWDHATGARSLLVRLLILQLAEVDPGLASYLLKIEPTLLGPDEEAAKRVLLKLGVMILRSGYLEIQRDVAHAAWRLRSFSGEELARFAGWIGAAGAAALVEYLQGDGVLAAEDIIVSQGHLLGRFLAGVSDGGDEAKIAEVAAAFVHDGTEGQEQLASWLGSRAAIADRSFDPFAASWALWQVLLMAGKAGSDIKFSGRGQTFGLDEWVRDYLRQGLQVECRDGAETGKLTGRLASACLRLAAYACSGEAHLTSCSEKKEPLALWLERVWIMATKLLTVLARVNGDLGGAAQNAVSAVEELGLERVEGRVLDFFDPYAFGPDADDLEMVLIMTAILKTLRARGEGAVPSWLPEDCVAKMGELAVGRPVSVVGMEDHLKLVAPLRAQVLASEIIDIIGFRRSVDTSSAGTTGSLSPEDGPPSSTGEDGDG